MLATLFATCASQQSLTPRGQEQKIDSVHPGSIADHIYTNSYFRFSLEVPEGWKVASNAALRSLSERKKQLLAQMPRKDRYATDNEVDSPLLIMSQLEPTKDGQHSRMFQIFCTDISAVPGQPSAEGFLKLLAEASPEISPGREYSNTMEQLTVDGREFWRLNFTQQGSILWQGSHLASIQKRHILQFVLLSPDEDGLHKLETILRTVHFQAQSQ
jgi:hypothetical protein